MQRRCDRCDKPYEAKRSTSRYCSTSCRARQSTNPAANVVADLPTPDGTDSPLVASTRGQLASVDRLDTVVGQQALELARRMSSKYETGASVASLSKEFRAVMEVAMDGVNAAADPLDELRTRRELKRNAG